MRKKERNKDRQLTICGEAEQKGSKLAISNGCGKQNYPTEQAIKPQTSIFPQNSEHLKNSNGGERNG